MYKVAASRTPSGIGIHAVSMRTAYVGGDGGSEQSAPQEDKQRRQMRKHDRATTPSEVGGDSESVCGALLMAQSAQINSELLRLLIQVTAFQAKRFRRGAHVVMRALEFVQNNFAFERLHALGERS
jgi:hypothetical protein